ncbi:hypothetical protein ACTWJ8_33835 [Streptomyces sp. SDT5-1]|uniref:hypothetical protein n=1 Tax=Streptomyces sp. SDT5-1 TaxID=3406418 RepID=UPI003FD111EC
MLRITKTIALNIDGTTYRGDVGDDADLSALRDAAAAYEEAARVLREAAEALGIAPRSGPPVTGLPPLGRDTGAAGRAAHADRRDRLCAEKYGGTYDEIKAWAREHGYDISGAKANMPKPLGNAFAEAHNFVVPDSHKATAAEPLR